MTRSAVTIGISTAVLLTTAAAAVLVVDTVSAVAVAVAALAMEDPGWDSDDVDEAALSLHT